MSDIVTSQVFSNGETGITATKMNNIVGQASIQTDFVASKPLASSVAANDQLLLLTAGGPYARTNFSTITNSVSGSLTPAGVGQAGIVNALSGNSYDYIGGDNACHSLLYAGRTFNAVGNPNFEVDQKMTSGTIAGGGSGWIDRWSLSNSTNVSIGMSPGAQVASVPGTSFRITNKCLYINVTNQKASLAAGDLVYAVQQVEGIGLRELIDGAHSISILAYCNIALSFALAIRDPGNTRSLCKLCSVPAATWTLINLPNLPLFGSASGVTWTPNPGVAGYMLSLAFAVGSTFMPPSNDTFVPGNFVGAVGMDNILSKSVSTGLLIAFIQHEPGPFCTTLVDKPFSQNYTECQRYYQKSFPYSVIPAANTGSFSELGTWKGGTTVRSSVRFPVQLARNPTGVTIYGYSAAPHSLYLDGTPGDWGVTSPSGSTSQLGDFTLSSTPTGTIYTPALGHYTVDTGW